MNELVNLCLFLLFLAKLSLYFAPSIAYAILHEQVSGRAVSHTNRDGLIPAKLDRDGNKPARNEFRRAA